MRKFLYNKFVLTLIVIICSGMLMSTPLQIISIKINVVILVVCFFLFGKIIILKINKKNKIDTNFNLTYVLILACLPLLAAFMAFRVFGQNILSGFISNLPFYNFLILFYFYFYFKKRKKALTEVTQVIMVLGWISLIFFYSIRIAFPNLEFVVPSYDGTTNYTYTAYTLGSPCIPWCGMIYLAKYKKFNRSVYLIYFLLFISYIVIMQNARTFTLVLALCVIIFYARELSKTVKIKFFYNFLSLIIIFLMISNFVPAIGSFIDAKLAAFEAAFIATSGKEVGDTSANMRIFEVNIAYKYIQDNVYFGVGFLKSSTQSQYINDYFYPSDIGLIGITFNYGVVGLIILLYQIKYFYKLFISENLKLNSFLLGTSYYMLMRYILSITTGELLYAIGFTFMLLAILTYGLKTLKLAPIYNLNIKHMEENLI